MRLVEATLIAATLAASAMAAAPAAAGPFLTRNQSPIVAPYGLPSPLPARLPPQGSGQVSLSTDWSNAASIEGADESRLTIDAESVEVRARFERALGERFAFRAEIPWRQISAGSLDSVVETWHDIFGLPDGPRRRQPRDELTIRYVVDGEVEFLFDQEQSGLMDIPLAAGYQLHASDRNALSVWLGVKLPTGDAARLTGSGATDVSLSLAGESRLSPRWLLFGQLDATWLGDGDLFPAVQQDEAWSALAGLTFNAWRGLDLTVQAQANSALFDAPGTGLSGEATVLTFGGSYHTRGGWHFDVAVSEDIVVEASPDVVFHFGVSRDF